MSSRTQTASTQFCTKRSSVSWIWAITDTDTGDEKRIGEVPTLIRLIFTFRYMLAFRPLYTHRPMVTCSVLFFRLKWWRWTLVSPDLSPHLLRGQHRGQGHPVVRADTPITATICQGETHPAQALTGNLLSI